MKIPKNAIKSRPKEVLDFVKIVKMILTKMSIGIFLV